MPSSSNDRCPLPDGWHTVTPRIVARDARGLIDFIARVFDASGQFEAARPTTLSIGDSIVMVSEVGVRDTTPAFLHVYVHDADATCERAVEAGARLIEAPFDTPYGDRRGMVEDRWGNTWQIATYRARDAD